MIEAPHDANHDSNRHRVPQIPGRMNFRVSLAIAALAMSVVSPLSADRSCAVPEDDHDDSQHALSVSSAVLGAIDFPTSGTPDAQADFVRGVLFLHSFEYRDARQAFLSAQATDPTFAMAYWGEAMTYNHPIWLEEDVDSARAALARLAPTVAARAELAPTARERAYLAAVEILFGEGEKADRDQVYAEAMADLAAQYPDDLEAASFHALALMGTCHQGRDTAVYMRSAAIAEHVFDRNPGHPGAAHYLIHATDDPVHAPLGLRAARAYAEIAPAAGHALHMPSHIFLALGLWDEVSASNEDSWDAVADRVVREDWAVERHNYHALLWWHYALLQQGKLEHASSLLARMATDHEASGSRRTGNHLALMRAAHAVDAGVEGLPSAPEGIELSLASGSSIDFVRGLEHLEAGRMDDATQESAHIRERIEAALAKDRKAHHDGYSSVGGVRTAAAEVMALQLDALIAEARGKIVSAVTLAEAAVQREAETPFGFGPPVPAKPALELLGELLARHDRHETARDRLAEALRRTPRRPRIAAAQLEVARALEDNALAARSLELLRSVSEAADSGVLAARIGRAASGESLGGGQ